jgi:dihydrodipicolinate synthase/N-acetylneuraminate lyase
VCTHSRIDRLASKFALKIKTLKGIEQMKTLQGIIPPVVTPFLPTEELDENALRREVRFLLDANVHGISFGGSTGEGALLSDDELARGIKIIQEENLGKVPVLGGIIRNSTRDAVQAGLAVKRAGADVLMVTPPYYFGAFNDGNLEFYATLAKKIELPIVIYNVIQNNTISPQLMGELSEIKLVVGIKQSCGGIHALADMIAACGDKTLVFAAQDDLLFVSYMLGSVGAIAAILSLFPELCVKQWNAIQSSDLKVAKEIHERMLPVWRKIEGKAFPGKIKAALNLMGRRVGIARSPIGEPSKKVIDEIRQKLGKQNFIQSPG